MSGKQSRDLHLALNRLEKLGYSAQIFAGLMHQSQGITIGLTFLTPGIS